MRAGKLRRIVTIEQVALAQDGTGAPVETWSTFAANVWADIEEATGREQIQAGQVNPVRPVTIRIRYLAGVTDTMRVIYGTRTFQIETAVNVQEKNRELELTCLEQ